MPVQAPPPQTAAADIPLILPALTDAIEVAGGTASPLRFPFHCKALLLTCRVCGVCRARICHLRVRCGSRVQDGGPVQDLGRRGGGEPAAGAGRGWRSDIQPARLPARPRLALQGLAPRAHARRHRARALVRNPLSPRASSRPHSCSPLLRTVRAGSQEFLNNCDQQAKLRELVARLPPVHNKVHITTS